MPESTLFDRNRKFELFSLFVKLHFTVVLSEFLLVETYVCIEINFKVS